jgi:transporter (fragment)
MLLFGALPLFFLELSLGQFAKSGPISVWNRMCPSMKGVGYCAVLMAWYVSFYYNNIIGWTIYYIITTISAGMP